MVQRERVLITGGSGFVGACLARNLIAEGHDVHLLLRPEFRNWRLADLECRYTPLWADLRDGDAVRKAVSACRPEVIYHLAAHGAYPAQKDRAAIMSTNLQGTINLLEALANRDYKALIHAGSSSEYGHKRGPIRETDTLEPRNDYAVSKAAASHLVLADAMRGRPNCVVRLFSAYGPWEEPTRLVPYVMGCCARGENPRVTAGHQPRDFIYVDDVLALLKRAARLPQVQGKVLHAGTGVQARVRDMIETILRTSGRKLGVQYGVKAMQLDEPESWVADTKLTRELTGWSPRHDLTAGVRAMWEWHQQQNSALQAA